MREQDLEREFPMLDDRISHDPRALRDAFGLFATGVTVVTMHDDAGRATGVTVNSFSSVSIEPALCLFSLGRDQISRRWLEDNRPFTVNVLRHEQDAVAWQFARPAQDKFADIRQDIGQNGVPYLADALCRFECGLWARYDGGDHEIVVGRITHFQSSEGDPMLFYRGKVARLGE